MTATKTAAKPVTPQLVATLNEVLAWELRAQNLYSHYAAYVKGIYRLHLKPFFEAEAAESVVHAQAVREQIVKLGGEAITERAGAEIVHTTDYQEMLRESLATETEAARGYRELLDSPGLDDEMHDAIEQIYFQEERSIEELTQLIES